MKFWAVLSRSTKMVTIRNIRKIPQAMLDKIKMLDNAYYEKQTDIQDFTNTILCSKMSYAK